MNSILAFVKINKRISGVVFFLSLCLFGLFLSMDRNVLFSDPAVVVWEVINRAEIHSLASEPKLPTTKKKKGQRSIAQASAAKIVLVNGVKKLDIELRFICSSWMYLRANDNTNSPDFWNEFLCERYARENTVIMQSIYDKNKIPINFRYRYELEEPHWVKAEGTFKSLSEINQRVNEDQTPENYPIAMNPDAPHFRNPYVMPSIHIEDFADQLTYFPATAAVPAGPSTPAVPAGPSRRFVDLSTCSPWASTSCGDSNSLTAVSNFTWRWGRNRPAGECGTLCSARSWPASSYIYNSKAVSDSCSFSCECVHWANDKATWKIQPRDVLKVII